MAQERNNFWNEAGKAGLVIAAVAVAYFLISATLPKIGGPKFLTSILSFVLWAGKFALCIWLMVKYLRKFAEENEKDRSRTFRFGMAVALCSAVVYAGFYLAYVLLINPDMFTESFNNIAQAYSSFMTSDQIDQMMNMESSLPTVTFFVNLIWCWLFGTIVSAIASRSICGSDNPFEDED
jgi:hypothetical protein